MEQVIRASVGVTSSDAVPESVEEFRKASIQFAEWALRTLRGDLLIRALEVSRSMVEFANFFDER